MTIIFWLFFPEVLNCHETSEGEVLIESACRSHGEVCPDYLKMELLTGWISRADQGAPGVKEMLTLTPCDLFPFIRGRTLWILGDSQALVSSPSSPSRGKLCENN